MSMNWAKGLAEGVSAGLTQYNTAQKMAMARELLNQKIEKYKQDQAYKSDQRTRISALFQDPATLQLAPQQFIAKAIQAGIDPNTLKALQPWMGPQASLANLKLVTQRKLAAPNTPEDERRNAADMNLRLFGKRTADEVVEIARRKRALRGGGGSRRDPEDKAKWTATIRILRGYVSDASREYLSAQGWAKHYRISGNVALAQKWQTEADAAKKRLDTARGKLTEVVGAGWSGGGPPMGELPGGGTLAPAPAAPSNPPWGGALPGASNQPGALPVGQRPYVPGRPPPFVNTMPNYRVIKRAQ